MGGIANGCHKICGFISSQDYRNCEHVCSMLNFVEIACRTHADPVSKKQCNYVKALVWRYFCDVKFDMLRACYCERWNISHLFVVIFAVLFIGFYFINYFWACIIWNWEWYFVTICKIPCILLFGLLKNGD